MKFKVLVVLLCLFLLTASAHGMRLGGQWDGVTRWQNKGDYSLDSHLRLWLSYRSPDYLLRTDLDGSTHWNSQGIHNNLEVQRLFLRLYQPNFDITIGRQRIPWGVGNMWSPIDILNPPPVSLLSGSRPGVDAAQIRVPLGPLAYASGLIIHKDDELGYGFHSRANLSGKDVALSLLSSTQQRPGMMGLEVKGDYLIGYHGELRYQTDDTWAYLIGADYSLLDGQLILQTEYYYDGSGTASLQGYQLGVDQRYIMVGASYSPDEFNSLNLAFVRNLQDNSMIILPSWDTILSGQWNLGTSAALFRGCQGTEFVQEGQPTLILQGTITYKF